MSHSLLRGLLDWYDANKRAMPWRGHPDAYAVWVSEIMLQQTQVETVIGYFDRFLAKFPSVAALAAASSQDVLKAWEGLGYYTRARNLQRAAQRVVEQGGNLPRTVEGWAALPGVGAYTAAAIASICFGVSSPVVDGNVARVFARFLGWPDDFRKPVARQRLADWLQPHIAASGRPGDFNQAMMDLGAMVCTPRRPSCTDCPLRRTCLARREGRQEEFPFRPPKKAVPTRLAVAVVVRDRQGLVLFTRREDAGLLGGLWELPTMEVSQEPTSREALWALNRQAGVRVSRATALGVVAHVFSHFKLQLYVYAASVSKVVGATAGGDSVRFASPSELPLATATRRALALSRAR